MGGSVRAREDAELRDEASKRYLSLPLVERLRAAIALIARASSNEIAGVVTPEDLLIHKMLKLRVDRRRLLQDLADVRSIIQTYEDRLDWVYLRNWLPEHEAVLVESVAKLDDEELMRRILNAP